MTAIVQGELCLGIGEASWGLGFAGLQLQLAIASLCQRLARWVGGAGVGRGAMCSLRVRVCALPGHLIRAMHVSCCDIGWVGCCRAAGAADAEVQGVIDEVKWLLRNEKMRRNILLRATIPRWPVSGAAMSNSAPP